MPFNVLDYIYICVYLVVFNLFSCIYLKKVVFVCFIIVHCFVLHSLQTQTTLSWFGMKWTEE